MKYHAVDVLDTIFSGSILLLVMLLSACQSIPLSDARNAAAVRPPSPASAAGPSDELIAEALVGIEAQMVGNHFYVSPDGDDENDGLSPETPFETVLQGIISLRAGDTLHLAPGDYWETMMTLRDGTPDAPITIIGPPDAVIRGSTVDNVLVRINNDHHTLYGFTVDGLYGDETKIHGFKDKLLYAIKHEPRDGIRGLRILNMNFRNAGGECVRLRYFVEDSEVAYSRFKNCGVWDFVFDDGGKVGEGVYVGTSSKQWGNGKSATDEPDVTTRNWIHHNYMETLGNECVEAKEGATGNIFEYNVCTGQKDRNSAGIVSRGSGNIIRYNRIYGSVGAGVRVGGHLVDGVQYGQENQIYGNELFANEGGGVKITVPNQAKVCGNVVYENGKGPTAGAYGSEYDPAGSCE